MGLDLKEAGRLVLVGSAGGLATAAVLLAASYLTERSGLQPSASGPRLASEAASRTPALDYLDTFRCPRGLRRIIQIGGQEDGFDRAGAEPSRIAPALAAVEYYRGLASGGAGVFGLRGYDEAGPDKLLVDHMAVPEGLVSGELVLRLRPAAGNADNDYVRLAPAWSAQVATAWPRYLGYALALSDPAVRPVGPAETGVRAIALDALKAHPENPFRRVADDVADTGGGEMSITLNDDTTVDVMALALCVEPKEVRGLTFVEHAAKPLGPQLSYFTCAQDETARMCDPYQGDTPCSQALPVACYRPGSAPLPDNLAPNANAANFVGGEIRLSAPVPGSRFATREAATAFCAAQFGPGWRLLTYQEGGGSTVISRSQLEPGARAWTDIRDQPRATCWSRPGPPGASRPDAGPPSGLKSTGN